MKPRSPVCDSRWSRTAPGSARIPSALPPSRKMRGGALALLALAGLAVLTLAAASPAQATAGYRIDGPVSEWRLPQGLIPSDLAVDSEDHVYVPMNGEWGQHVRVYDPDGAILTQFGGWGTGNGEFRRMQGVAVDADDVIYVSDDLNRRIQTFLRDGSGTDMVISYRSQFPVPTYPYNLTFNAVGDILLGGYWDDAVYHYTSGGVLLHTFGGFDNPRAVAVDSAGDIYVLETWRSGAPPFGRLQKLDSDGNHLATLATSGSGDGQLYYPTDIVVDADDILYVTDNFNHRIQVFTTSGVCLGWYGKGTVTSGWHEPGSGETGMPGSGPGEFRWPHAIVIDHDGYLYVGDHYYSGGYYYGRLQKLEREPRDSDGDGVLDDDDNCPLVANADQADYDEDGIGDACDADDDNDGVQDEYDNCPFVANADQADYDEDDTGDACDADDDNDGLADADDACPFEHPGGRDANADGCTDRVEDLPDTIGELALPDGTATSLLASAAAATTAIERGDIQAARGQLGALINKIEAQRGKKIPESSADMLIAFARHVLEGL